MLIPAILENNKKKYLENLKAVLALKNIKSIQIDFADGEFVATKTLSITEIELPTRSKILFEAHLMVKEPKDFELYQKAGFKKIIIHYEAFKSELDLEAAIEEIKKLKMIPAIAISPTSEISVIRYHTDTIKDFTLLAVVPGRQGQKMLPATFDRLRELRDHAPGANIEIDGGVDSKNIASLIDAGATDCVAGSSLLRGDIKENYKVLMGALK